MVSKEEMKIIEEPWVDFLGNQTTALFINKEGLYTISEFIVLLEEAKKKFGDKTILIHSENVGLSGFSHVYLNQEYDERKKYGESAYEEATICII